MKKKLAIIGASYLQLPVVKRAQEMGLEVTCFAWKEGAVCADYADHFYPISTRDKEAILKVCKEIKIDGITTIASDTSVLAVNYVASRMGLISNPDDYSEVTTNKYLMRKCFINNDVPSPKFLKVSKGERLDGSTLNYPVIVKPTDRSGSIGVQKINDKQLLQSAIERAQEDSFTQEAIVEEFVEGREVSVESISYKGHHYILQITDKVTTEAPYFVELAHHQPSNLSEDIQKRIRQIVEHALTALHVQYGASHSELKITKEGDIKVIEIGARMGGDFIGSNLVKLSTGYDFLQGVINVAMGSFTEPEIKFHKFSGVYFLSEETKWLKKYILNYKDYPQIVKAEITDKELHHIECSGDRSGYLIYQSDKGRFNIHE